MKIAVLLSGGVDSAVALHEALAITSDVTAYYLKIWLEDELAYLGNCPWEEDLEYARAVCEQAGVPLNVVSLQKEYFDRVVSYAISELKDGRTPSPDVFCNQRIKFGAFFDKIDNSYDKVVSGHYAQVLDRGDHFELGRSPDPVKDQTYFLSYMRQDQLARALFPVGRMLKAEVRERAAALELPNRDRKDSQGICFLGKLKYNDFVKHYLGEKDGEIREESSGEVLGQHKGFWFHTIGQRSGLGLGNGPWYVSGKDTDRNIVFVTHQRDLQPVNHRSLVATKLNWLYKAPVEGRIHVKLRHGPALVPAQFRYLDQDRVEVVMDEGDQGIAPGQFCVMYDGEVCLGAGTIE